MIKLNWKAEQSQQASLGEIMLILQVEDITSDVLMNQMKLANHFKMKMLAALSHELRTPLNCSLIMLDLLIKLNDLQPDIKNEYLKPVFYSNNLLLYMVSNILDYSQLSENRLWYHYKKFNLHEAVEECKNLI